MKKMSNAEIVRAYLDASMVPDPEESCRVKEERFDTVNAFIEEFSIKKQDAGILAGLTVGVKDIFDVAGVPNRLRQSGLAEYTSCGKETCVCR